MVIGAMEITEQGDGIVQRAGCGWVVGKSLSEEATFQLRPEGSGLAKGWSGSEAFQAGEAARAEPGKFKEQKCCNSLTF